jgi:hypothetical protein
MQRGSFTANESIEFKEKMRRIVAYGYLNRDSTLLRSKAFACSVYIRNDYLLNLN